MTVRILSEVILIKNVPSSIISDLGFCCWFLFVFETGSHVAKADPDPLAPASHWPAPLHWFLSALILKALILYKQA